MSQMTRRNFVTAAAAVSAGVAAQAAFGQAAATAKGTKIIAISCSPRKGMTTSAALGICLEAAKAVDPSVEVELIELSGVRIAGDNVGAAPIGEQDEFPKLAAKLADPKVGGIIIGTPVYLSGPSALCKVFLDRTLTLRKDNFALRNKVGGVVAVGGIRNGGQEMAIQAVQSALLCHDMIIVGDGKPTAHSGATLFNDGKDDITTDQFGLATAKGLGRRVAEVALRMSK